LPLNFVEKLYKIWLDIIKSNNKALYKKWRKVMEKSKDRQAGILYLGIIVFGMIAQIIRSNIFVFDNKQ
jgi:hypothetical protein